MKFRLTGTFLLLFTALSVVAAENGKGPSGTPANQVIVKFRESGIRAFRAESSLNTVMKATGAIQSSALMEKSNPIADEIGLNRVYVLNYQTITDADRAVSQLTRRTDIEYAELVRYFSHDRLETPDKGNKPASPMATPDDELLASVHPLGQVKAFQAWDLQTGDTSVVVAVVDTGVDWDHEDLVSSVYINQGEYGPDGKGGEKQSNGVDDDANGFIDDFRGWDFISSSFTDSPPAPGEDASVEDNNPMDFNGHGTHVAGISAGMTNNGIGIASLSWGVKVLPCRIGYHTTSGDGIGNSYNMGRAFIYAADMGADVINLSFGNSGQFITDASLYATRKGTLVVSSAGNANDEFASEMELKPWVLTVAAVNRNDLKTYYSTYGTWVKISAPGGEQLTASSNGFLSTVVYPSTLYSGKKYEYFQGTSMASPFVASLAALIKSQNPEISVIDLFERIRQTSDDIYALNPTYAGKLGAGRINALRALTETGLSPAKPSLRLESVLVEDGGNENGILNLGETASLIFDFQNEWGGAENLTATLTTDAGNWPLTVSNNTDVTGPVASVLDSVESTFSVEFPLSVDENGIPMVIGYELTISDDNGFSQTFPGRLAIEPNALLVPDFHADVDYTNNYLELMDQAGLSYDVWNGSVDNITADILKKYAMVFWPMGWTFPSLTEANQNAISGYIEAGGRIYLSGQDVGWDMADPTGTTYTESGGASKTWFESYMKVVYGGDDNNETTIKGVDSDLLSDGVESSIEMPGLGSSTQYPDFVTLKEGTVAFLKYGNGQIAGTRYETGNARVVYLPFGGLEAVSDSVSANLLTARISNWLYGYSVDSFIPLKNTEDEQEDRLVSVSVSGKKPVSSVDLYYQAFTTGTSPDLNLTKLPMTYADGRFSASLPAVGLGNSVLYFFISRFEDGSLSPYQVYQYNVKTDVTKPVAISSSEWPNTMEKSGTYPVEFTVDDESGIDESSVFVHYYTSTGVSDSSSLTLSDAARSLFSGSISIPGPVKANTLISYYFTARDQSNAGNMVRHPASSDLSFMTGKADVDDMEVPGYWLFDGKFGYSTKRRLSGDQAIHNNKGNNYTSNDVSMATYSGSFDFTGYDNPAFTIQSAFRFGSGDTCYAEINTGNGWIPKFKFAGGSSSFWTNFLPYTIFAPEAAGQPTVQIRFRFVSDGVGSGTNSGIYFDDLKVMGDTVSFVSVEGNGIEIPTVLTLDQNYPNPFNPATVIRYSVPVSGAVRLMVFDALGREISVLVDEKKPAGTYSATFSATGLSSGVYFYKLAINGSSLTRKMLLLK